MPDVAHIAIIAIPVGVCSALPWRQIFLDTQALLCFCFKDFGQLFPDSMDALRRPIVQGVAWSVWSSLAILC